VKGQVVDGEGVTSLYSRLRKKHSVLLTVTKTDITMYESILIIGVVYKCICAYMYVFN